jgi:Cys-tRNA(Pro) deacylase
MGKESKDYPVTRAVHALRAAKIPFEPLLYRYEGPGSVAKDAAGALGLSEAEVFKTLVFLAGRDPVLVLANAAQRVSTRKVGRALGVDVTDCDPRDAERYTGYQVGGISPLGTKRAVPVLLDRSAEGLDTLCVNAGSHGFLVRVKVADLVRLLKARVGDWSIDPG